jgi:hypothetical protein
MRAERGRHRTIHLLRLSGSGKRKIRPEGEEAAGVLKVGSLEPNARLGGQGRLGRWGSAAGRYGVCATAEGQGEDHTQGKPPRLSYFHASTIIVETSQ